MSEFQRYAIYYLPDDPALARFGAAWLGWDIATGCTVQHTHVPGIDLASVTATPRKYGFHGTLKPPFRLAAGIDASALHEATGDLATRLAPVRLDGLRVEPLGHFLALVPDGDAADLDRLAFRCVTELDPFRAPPTGAELAKRRAMGLTPGQDSLLTRWGYPYVREEFRFHMTLSGRLDADTLEALRTAAIVALPPLPRPFGIASIALVGERPDGMFREIHRYALTG